MPKPIVIYLLLSAFFWLCCITIMAFWRFSQHRLFPYNSPFMPDYLCRDLWCYRPQFLALHSRDFFKFQGMEMFPYPPASALPFALFQNVLPRFHSIPFLSLTFLAVACLAALFVSELIRLGMNRWLSVGFAAATLFLMFPFWLVATTGNIEIVLFLLLSCGVLFYLRGRFALAAVFIGFCAAMKLYPFVLLVLLLSAKRYKEILIGIGTFIASSLVGLWLMCPDIRFAFHGTRQALQTNRVDYMETFLMPGSGFDHSIWGFVKSILFHITRHTHFPSRSITAYLACTALLGITLYFARIRHLPVLNQIFCLYLCMLLLVPESFEYTLIHLTVPFGLLVLYTIRRQAMDLGTKSLTAVFACLAFVFSPQNELVLNRPFWGQAKCVVLIILLGLALTRRWEMNSSRLIASEPQSADLLSPA